MDWLRAYRPDLVALYEELYARGAYAPAGERRRLAAMLRPPGTPPPSRLRVRDRAQIEARAASHAPAQARATQVQTTLF